LKVANGGFGRVMTGKERHMGRWGRRSVGHGGRVAIVALALAGSGLNAISRASAADDRAASPSGSEVTASTERAVNDKCKIKMQRKIRNGQHFQNPSGMHATVSTRDGRQLDTDNPFFSAALGTNGRSCVTCHAPEDGMSLRVSSIQERFEESCGLDPLFTGDGANAPGLDVSTVEARRAASSLLLSKGLIRIRIKPPANAQYELVSVDDPHGNNASMSDGIVVFRRPLPATNLKFLNAVMWDTREGRAEPGFVNTNLKNQARSAVIDHAEGAAPSDDVLQAIVDFQSALFTAQVAHHRAGKTAKGGATGGPYNLIGTAYAVDENRILPIPPPPASPLGVLTTNVFTLFNSWASSGEAGEDVEDDADDDDHGGRQASRQSVARGEQIFNNRLITDRAPDGTLLMETCSACHNAFNAGNMSHSLATGRPFAGSASVRVSEAAFRTPDVPLYTFKEKIAPFRTLVTTDPGQALKTGLTRDWNRFKSSNLRGLASRAPYFHNGMAATIADIVDHYDIVMNPVDAAGNPLMTPRFTAEEKADLIAFLESL
jgi:cytochrome c peroxidase